MVMTDIPDLDMGPVFRTQSNPVNKYLVLNRTRKLCVTRL